MMYKPIQKTNLGGGINVAEETRLHAPQLLSRPMMMTNFVLRKLGQDIEPRIDKAATQRYLDPQLLAKELEKFTPAAKQSIVKDMIQRGYLPGMAGTASVAASEVQQ
jgi:hypothetical protein